MNDGRMMSGKPIVVGDLERLVERRARSPTRGTDEADLGHRLLEALAVLGGADRLGLGADQLDAVARPAPRARRAPSRG